MILGVAVVGILSFLFGKFAFTLIPVFIADFSQNGLKEKRDKFYWKAVLNYCYC